MSLSGTGIRFKNNTVSVLNGLLGENNKDASVSISWSGQRLVSFTRFPDKKPVDINLLVKEYLNAKPKCSEGIKNLKARLDFYDLWTKMKMLCEDDKNLNKTWIYRFLVPIKEFFEEAPHCGYIGVAKNYIIMSDVDEGDDDEVPSINNWSFSFSPNDFRKLWPTEEPRHICYFEPCIVRYLRNRGDVQSEERWVATKEMVAEAYARVKPKKK